MFSTITILIEDPPTEHKLLRSFISPNTKPDKNKCVNFSVVTVKRQH